MQMLSKKDFMRYDAVMDSQYFIGDFSDEDAQSPSELEPTYSSYQILNQTQTINVNNQAVIFKNNEYFKNLAGSRRSVVQIEGFPLFESINETYFENDNWF